MTINEYKGKFLELFEEMQKEHGAVRYVHIEQNLDMLPVPNVPIVTKVIIEF